MIARSAFYVTAAAGSAALFAASLSSAVADPAPAWPPFTPPATRTVEVEEEWHGIKVRDPYRWLEDTESPEVQAWIDAQANAARQWLEALPLRTAFKKRLEELVNYDKHGLPRRLGGRLFYSRLSGLQNQAVHYWRDDVPGAEERLLLDPNTLSEDGTVSVSSFSVSPDGRYVAYGLAHSGSDWQEIRVLEVDSGKTLAEELKWVKFSRASWAADSQGFYYSRYDEPAADALKAKNEHHKIWYHRLGTSQAADKLIHHRPDQPEWLLGGGETEDGQFLLISASKGAAGNNAVFYAERQEDGSWGEVKEIRAGFDARYHFVGNDGRVFYFNTDYEAPRGRLVAMELGRFSPEAWRTIIPESSSVLQTVSYVGGKFIASYLVDAHDEVVIYDRDGKKVRDLPINNFAAVGGFGGKQSDEEVFYLETGFTQPAEIYRYRIADGKTESWQKTQVPFDTEGFVTKQLFYHSKDGTRVPLFVVHQKGLTLNGQNSTLLYGYGGFNHAMTPSFFAGLMAWLERGGVYAVACLRGGSEYGEAWHEAGKRLKKQNVFDDFIAAAEYLVAEKYTSPSRLVIQGGSNGGLLVAACLLQRPDLFAAAAPSVGVYDMLRFHRFTIGYAWQDEYGYPETNEADFKNLLSYSPLHNVKPGVSYPPTLIMTADHDDRVFPAHSFKFAAALQAAQASPAPVVLRVETKAGHGAGTPTAKMIESMADRFAFFAEATGMK